MKNDALADRLTNYADALVATAFILMSALGASVGDPDIRCELASAAPKILFVVCFGGLGIIFSIHWLSAWSERLRGPADDTDDAQIIQKKLKLVRYALSISFVVIAVVFVLASLTDNLC